jgi:hypothetical protein
MSEKIPLFGPKRPDLQSDRLKNIDNMVTL